MSVIKPFDIVKIVGNYGSFKHPETNEKMQKGHLGLVLYVNGGYVNVRPFGYPFTAEFLSNEVKLKCSMNLERDEVLSTSLESNSFLIHAFDTNDKTCTTIIHNVDEFTIIGVSSVTLDKTKSALIHGATTTPSEG